MRTFLLAGFALKIIFSPVKGFTPSRAFVAGFFTTFIFATPGNVNRPWARRLLRMIPLRESNTAPISFFERPVSFEICARTSDLVGGLPFAAISLLLVWLTILGRRAPSESRRGK